jgi:acyl carrier protein
MDVHQLMSEISHRKSTGYADETLLSDLDNWDSLKGVRLVIRLEELMGRELSEEEIGALRSIGDVRKLLQPVQRA